MRRICGLCVGFASGVVRLCVSSYHGNPHDALNTTVLDGQGLDRDLLCTSIHSRASDPIYPDCPGPVLGACTPRSAHTSPAAAKQRHPSSPFRALLPTINMEFSATLPACRYRLDVAHFMVAIAEADFLTSLAQASMSNRCVPPSSELRVQRA
jgi:hypothetical protein